jgi:hypothetical protein
MQSQKAIALLFPAIVLSNMPQTQNTRPGYAQILLLRAGR